MKEYKYIVICNDEELFDTFSLKDAVDFCIRSGNKYPYRHYSIKLDGTTIFEYKLANCLTSKS